jgi:hypothetical protein
LTVRHRGADKGGVIAQLGIALWLVAAPPSRGEFQVNSGTAGDQGYPAVCVDAQGGAVLAWESRGGDADGNAIVARRFDGGDAALGSEAVVNQTTTGDQQAPALACAPDGGFVVVWESRGQDGDDFGIAAQRFDAAGAARGGEQLVNQRTAGRQRAAAACADAAGGFVVAWQSNSADGDGYGVVAQRLDQNGARRRLAGATRRRLRTERRLPGRLAEPRPGRRQRRHLRASLRGRRQSGKRRDPHQPDDRR